MPSTVDVVKLFWRKSLDFPKITKSKNVGSDDRTCTNVQNNVIFKAK